MSSEIGKLASAAERLRQVRKAQEKFLGVWAVECIWDQPRPAQRIAAEVEYFEGESFTSSGAN